MYAFIDCNREHDTVEMMARILRISARSYYDHKRGKHNLREHKREALEWLIQQIYEQHIDRSRDLCKGLQNGRPQPGMIFHSDQGVQYTCEELRNTLDKNVCPDEVIAGIMPWRKVSSKALSAS